MNSEHEPADEQLDQLPEAEAEAPKPLPMLCCQGEGYITRKDGTVVHFTIQGEG